MLTPSTAKQSANMEVPTMSSAAKEMPTAIASTPFAAREMPGAVKVKVEVPDTPPVVSSLKKPSEVSVFASSVQPPVEDDEVVILMETVSKKFGEMTFSDYNSAADSDFSLSSDIETEDSLEWASETERTRAEDDLMENKVGIDYVSAALDIATEQAASFRIVQAGLVIGDWVLGTVENITSNEVAPLLSSVRRSARKIRRAGERVSGPFRPLGMVSESTLTMATTFLAAPLALLGWEFRPVIQAKAKKVRMEEKLSEAVCTFEELDLSNYDSDMDADYSPSEENSSSEDDLEFCTEAADESTEAEESLCEE